ncbi:MAG: DUF1800 domain-containing protein [Armatimonadetes bacterium]|nr:DUF1800 domain-containing protein [Armatimonadota bacterium]
MKLTLASLGLALLALSPPILAAPPEMQVAPTTSAQTFAAFSRPLKGEKRFAHVLNRLAFGPRPGDIEALRQTGIKPWIESQLSPQAIDDAALDRRLASLSWLRESPERLLLAYESDTAAFLRRMQKAEKGEIAAPRLTPAQKETVARIEAANIPERASIRALGELSTDKLARAIESNRQLQEVLVDFWGNHFNVDINKGFVRALKIRDDRDVIRPHVFGSFRELLGASAHSPAMLWYLDNARSTREFPARGGQKRGGLNENYARELMELHTLGVDGGYTQSDVTEVARCFTGWSLDRQTGTFLFRARAHDEGPKTVLGQRIARGGKKDGEKVLDILAASPATARFIAHKLCVRFVADKPPTALVERVAAAFSRSNGDLKTTYRAVFEAPEFLSEGAYRAKIKSPLEFTVSAVRALGGSLETGAANRRVVRLLASGVASLNRGGGGQNRIMAERPLAAEIALMGQPLFACQPPTGYAEDSTKWVSSSALVARLNFALGLTSGRVGDVVLTRDTFRATAIEDLSRALLNTDISASTRATVEAEAQKSPGDGARLHALLLASPEFQRR